MFSSIEMVQFEILNCKFNREYQHGYEANWNVDLINQANRKYNSLETFD